ncbi:ATP-binding protein [Actinomyces culturomici]|uniref:ATP-binding protein n=1 Tax=Actinomyces culturomici TaxID=1926276 RepID=UPI001F326CC0|nr:DUF4143 domain-containing protein [Actinomyces culturomici]
MADYRSRIADDQLRRALARAGAVVIEGPKACGKTETALQCAQSVVEVDTDPNVAQLMMTAPELILDGENPRLFDEWHLQPALWNLVRRRVDREKTKGLFILTGSAAPSADLARHSGAGRFARVRMSTMSLAETGHSTGAVSLANIVAGSDVSAGDPGVTLPELLDRLTCGGWPGFLNESTDAVLEGVRDYLTSLVEVDLPMGMEIGHDPVRVRRLLVALARGVATETSIATLVADTGLARETVVSYLSSLMRVFAIEDQPAWSSHLRSKASLRKEGKRHLADPSLAVAALRADPRSLLRDLRYAGQLFESQVVHDLRVYSAQLVSHARDSAGAEVDAVIEYPGGPLLLIEIKLGWHEEVLDAAAASLTRFAAKIDPKLHPDVIRLVITGGGYAFTRTDGVRVVPLTALTR